MNASGMNFGSREQEVSTISRSLKGLAKELNIPVIALSQLNRSVENRQGLEGKRPQLADLRESGAIEQDADIVCFIHRPEYYKIFEDGNGNSLIGLAEIIVAKHRNGATGDVRLRFKSEFAKFMNIGEDMPVREYVSGISSHDEYTPEPISPAEADFIAAGGRDNTMPF
jgi:replicative DNA helicase